MKFALASALLAVLPALCSATYFTNPTAGTVWSSPQGETITWKFQAGGAAVGTIVLESEATNPKSNTQTVLADSIDLTLEELAWPVGLSLPAVSTTSFRLLIVNTDDTDTVYTTVGPFTIESLSGSSSSAAATTTRAASTSTTPFATPRTRSSSSSSSTPSPSSSSTTTTTTTTTITTRSTTTLPSSRSTSSSSPSSSSPSSSSTTTTTEEPSTATVLSTASVVTLTSTSSSDNNVVTILSTATGAAPSASSSSASGSVGAAQSGGATSGAAKRVGAAEMLFPKGWSAVGTVLLGVAAGMVVLG